MKRTIVSTLALLSFAAVAAFGQSNATSPATPTGKTIRQRKVKQQKRIAQGVKNGSLTPGETARLEKKERKINKEERRMRRRNDGKLTRADKARLTRQQNRTSKQIYKKKHNDRKRG
jgi:hypothetical protein